MITISSFDEESGGEVFFEAAFSVICNIPTVFMQVIESMLNSKIYTVFDVQVSISDYMCMLADYSDGTGQTAIDRLMKNIPLIRSISINSELGVGNMRLFPGGDKTVCTYNRYWFGIPCVYCGKVVRHGKSCPNCGA